MALFIETELKSKSECGVIIMGVINLFLSVRERKKCEREKAFASQRMEVRKRGEGEEDRGDI